MVNIVNMSLPRTVVCKGSTSITYRQPGGPPPGPTRCTASISVNPREFKPGDRVYVDTKSILDRPLPVDSAVAVIIYLEVAGRKVRVGGASGKIPRGYRGAEARGYVRIPNLGLRPGRYSGRMTAVWIWEIPALGTYYASTVGELMINVY